MVFQSYALYPHLTVYKNIAFPLKARASPRTAQEEGRVGGRPAQLGHLLDRKPRELSGGERQRVASPARSSASPACSCSTSRCPTSTPSSGRRRAPSSAVPTTASVPRRSMPPRSGRGEAMGDRIVCSTRAWSADRHAKQVYDDRRTRRRDVPRLAPMNCSRPATPSSDSGPSTGARSSAPSADDQADDEDPELRVPGLGDGSSTASRRRTLPDKS